MGNKNTPIIRQDDIELMVRIGKHGFVDMDYIYKFLYAGKKQRTIHDRITQLVQHNYLIVDRTFIPLDYTTSYRTGYRIISLGTKGIKFIHDMGYDTIDSLVSMRNASPYRRYHQVQVTTVCDTLLDQYCKDGSNWILSSILNEKEAYFDDILNQPDAILLFQSIQKPDLFTAIFLEIERSYASMRALERKLINYEISFKSNAYKEKLDKRIISNRLLFVAQTDAQLAALKDKIKISTHGKSICTLVTGYQEITNKPLETIYYHSGSEQMCKLLGAIMKNNDNKTYKQ